MLCKKKKKKKKNFAVIHILWDGMWKSQSKLSVIYLMDITHKSLDIFYIEPLVIAQEVG